MKKSKCFTLLEILIALAILVVGVAGVINMFPIGLHATKRAADFTMAGILAQEKMAEVMYLGSNRIDEIHENIGIIPGSMGTVKEPFASPDDQYRWFLYLDEGITSDLTKATVLIYWNDRGIERYARFTTFITYIADYS